MNIMHNDVQQIERQAGLEIILQLWLIYWIVDAIICSRRSYYWTEME